jgi:predicted RNA-binding protein YlxR (DUF448 family)
VTTQQRSKVSLRRCLVCRQTAEAQGLIRFVLIGERIVLDTNRGLLRSASKGSPTLLEDVSDEGASAKEGKPMKSLGGRGCSLHLRRECIDKMLQPKLWARALKAPSVDRATLVALQELVLECLGEFEL